MSEVKALSLNISIDNKDINSLLLLAASKINLERIAGNLQFIT
jgi:hypothetical protein